jgi:predicted membrane-bound spermidine synthase
VFVLITLILAVIGLASAEALVRIAADQERPSHIQEVVFRSALGGLLGSAVFLAAMCLRVRNRRKGERA